MNFHLFNFARGMTTFLLKFCDLSGAKVYESCRSRQELSNDYLLAKIGVDTAENEPLKSLGKIQFIIHSPPSLGPRRRSGSKPRAAARSSSASTGRRSRSRGSSLDGQDILCFRNIVAKIHEIPLNDLMQIIYPSFAARRYRGGGMA